MSTKHHVATYHIGGYATSASILLVTPFGLEPLTFRDRPYREYGSGPYFCAHAATLPILEYNGYSTTGCNLILRRSEDQGWYGYKECSYMSYWYSSGKHTLEIHLYQGWRSNWPSIFRVFGFWTTWFEYRDGSWYRNQMSGGSSNAYVAEVNSIMEKHLAEPELWTDLVQACVRKYVDSDIFRATERLGVAIVDADLTYETSLSPYSFHNDEYNMWIDAYRWDRIRPQLRDGLREAYWAAFDKLPSSPINFLETLVDIKNINLFKMARSLKDVRELWLSYRYGYRPTASDIEGVTRLHALLTDLKDLSVWSARGTYASGHFVYRCSIRVRVEDIIPDDVFSKLDLYLGQLSLSRVWDLVPFSFVVDWFLGIGDFLERIDKLGESISFHPIEIWYSFESSYPDINAYGRFVGPKPRGIGRDNYTPSTRTILSRIVDGICLISLK